MSVVSPPHDLAAEQAVLGSIMLSDVPMKALIVDLGLNSDAFYRDQHGKIWDAMVAVTMSGARVDELTLKAQLAKDGAKGLDVLVAELPGMAPAAGNVLRYARQVIESAEWRNVLRASYKLTEAAASASADARREAESMLHAVRRGSSDTRSPRALAEDVLKHLEGHTVPAWKTPWPSMNDAMGGGLRAGETTLLGGWTSMGKALDVATPIPTPGGYRAMLDVRVGEQVFDETGAVCRVTAVTEVQFGRPCMEVVFSDGERIVADEEHEWLTWTDAARRSEASAARRPRTSVYAHDQQGMRVRPAVRTTREIAGTLDVPRRRKRGGLSFNHSIPFCGPLEYPESPLPVDPYVLGAWLGDGNSRTAAITTADPEILDHIKDAGHEIRPHGHPLHFGIGSLTTRLRSIGVLGNKHIPTRYLHGSPPQRLALLQGLMDTDGYASKLGQCEFCTTSPRLAADVCELILGLGIGTRVRTSRATFEGRDCGPKFRIGFTTATRVFRLKRKLERLPTHAPKTLHRRIVAVKKVPTRPVKCIEVSSPSSLYLAGHGFVPTHNSVVADQLLRFCRDQGAKVHLYINEMAPTMRALRTISSVTEVPQRRLAQPTQMTPEDWTLVMQMLGETKGEMPFGITRVTDWTAEEVARDIRFRGWDVCALDMLHKLPFENERELAQISAQLTAAAQTANTHLVATVHLNEARATAAILPSPVLRDIRYSGMLKNDADNVLFVHRKEEEDMDGNPERTDEASIYLHKCRNGRLHGVRAHFDDAKLRFLETTRYE